MSNKPGFFRQLKDTQNYSTKFLIVLFSPNSGVTPNRTTREREKTALNSKDIINRLSELDKSDPNALLIIQTPNKDVVKRIEKEIAEHGKDERYIVIFGDENVNAKQAQQDSIKRINAIKNVLNSDSVSPVSTSDNDPAPAPAPAPSPRRYRP